MNPTTQRNLLILVAVVIVIGAVAFVLLTSGGGGDSADQPEVVQEQTSVPQQTAAVETDTPEPSPTPALVPIVVAVQNISRGAEIPAEALRLQPWPLEALPFNSYGDINEVAGLIARTDLYPEQPILTSMVVDNLEDLAAIGSDAAAILPPGKVAVSLPIDRITSVAFAIQPGDRVDIIVSLLFIDMDETFQSALPNTVNLIIPSEDLGLNIGPDINGRFDTRRIPYPVPDVNLGLRPLSIDWPVIITPSEPPRPRLLTQRTVLDAQVIWTGNFPIDGRLFVEVPTQTPVNPSPEPGAPPPTPTPPGLILATEVPPRPDIVTLAVDPQEAVMITWLVEAGVPVTFALRSAGDRSLIPTDSVTLDYILSEFDIVPPTPVDYTIEPAIRSIRRIILDNTISLGG